MKTAHGPSISILKMSNSQTMMMKNGKQKRYEPHLLFMKILYAIQCTGNGHLSRAQDVIPHLMRYGDVHLFLSGRQADVSLIYDVHFRKHGLYFVFGKKGGIDFLDTFLNLKPIKLMRDIRDCPVEKYDVIINDFEPITAWACKRKKISCTAFSHQSAFLSQHTPRPFKKNHFAEMLFHNYAPVSDWIGLHFKTYDQNIFTPVIRPLVRKAFVVECDHVTVYLPAYEDAIVIKQLRTLKQVRWEIFSKRARETFSEHHITVRPIQHASFVRSMATSCGVLTGGGFETPAEAIFLGKKLFSIPMADQYEQQCNSQALSLMGIPVTEKIDHHFPDHLLQWLKYSVPIKINYSDLTEILVARIMKVHNMRPAGVVFPPLFLDWRMMPCP